MKKIFSFSLLFLATPGFGYIPPLNQILRDVVSARRPISNQEIVFRHRFLRGAEIVEFDEHLLKEGGVYSVYWKSLNGATTASATYQSQAYQFQKERIAPRSQIFIKSLFTNSVDEFRETLIAERFIRRDQFAVYTPGFVLEGDPASWNLREKTVRHFDIYLQRLRSFSPGLSGLALLGLPVGIAVAGLDEPNAKRVVVFERSLNGLSRLEWREDPKREGPKVIAWNFEKFSRASTVGNYPRFATFEVDGNAVISSEILSVKSLNPKQLTDFKTAWRASAGEGKIPPAWETALKYLLSYR